MESIFIPAIILDGNPPIRFDNPIFQAADRKTARHRVVLALRLNKFVSHVTKLRKNIFKKEDDEFDEIASDPIRRRAKIVDLTWRRKWIFYCALVMMIIAVIGVWGGGKGAVGVVLTAAFAWGSFISHQSDLRLLRVIERIEKDRPHTPPSINC